MPTPIETWVLDMLSAVEVPLDAAEQIERAGPEAVNVVCEAALGTYVGLRPKVRTNAAWVVGRMTAEQARDTLMLLVTDPDDGVAIRAIRAAGRLQIPELDARVALALERDEADPLLVVEAVAALAGSPTERQALQRYVDSTGSAAPAHRRNAAVERAIRRHLDTRPNPP
jgi:HEAT repeat protein